MFGKIENGVFVEAPKILKIGDMVCYNPKADTLLEQGYKPVEVSEYPLSEDDEEAKTYFATYVDEVDRIVQIWEEKVSDDSDFVIPNETDLLRKECQELRNAILSLGGNV